MNQRSLPGTIEYDNSGTPEFTAQQRADAYKKMTQSCHGPYRIESEGPELLEGGKYATAVWLIHFTCAPVDSAGAPRE